MICKSLIVGVGLAGVGLGLAGGFSAPAQAGAYTCSPSVTVGSCSQSLSVSLTTTEWSNINFVMHLFNTAAYAPMTSMLLTVSGSIQFGPNSTITNTSNATENFTYTETTSFSFASTNAALQTALTSLSPPPIATDAQSVTGLLSSATFTLSTAPGTAFSSTLNGPIIDFGSADTSNPNLSNTASIFASTLTGQSTSGGGGNVNTSVTTKATMTLSYVYFYGSSVPEPLSAAVLGSGLLGLGMLRRRNKKV